MKKTLLSLLLTSSFLFAETLAEININNEELELQGTTEVYGVGSYEMSSPVSVFAHYSKLESSSLYGLGFKKGNGVLELEGVNLAFGMKVVGDEDFGAVPLLAEISYKLPFEAIPATYLSSQIFYAPKVLNFSNSEEYREIKAEINVVAIPTVSVYGGYRNVDVIYSYDFNAKSSKSLSERFYMGLKMMF